MWKYMLIALFMTGCQKQAQTVPEKQERFFPVNVAPVEERDVPVCIETIGYVSAGAAVDVRPQISGLIQEVYVKGGQHVRKGDPLYLIDPSSYQIALEKAKATLMRHQAELEFSQKKLERYAQLAKTDYVSKLNVEEFKRDVRIQEAQILADQAELQLAQLNLNECYVCAPVEGKVSLSTIDEGNLFIAYDQAILTQILQLSPVNVNFTLCQKDFQDLQPLLKKKGGRFEVILPYESQEKFEGEVTVIDNHINSETGTITLRGRVDNRDETLWPGQFVYVRFFVREKKGVPVIPQTAIQQGQKGTFVYVLQPDQTVEAVAIQTAEHFDDFVVVDQGLKPGMKIVTDGQLNLRSGVKVVVSAEIAQGQ